MVNINLLGFKRGFVKEQSLAKIIKISECGCNNATSSSFICDKTTGQCPCTKNSCGTTCGECCEGFYKFPDCEGKQIILQNS